MTTNDLVALFWGKAGPKEKGTAELHPALFHMLDVGMVARAMIERSPRTALRGLQLATGLSPDAAARRVGFLVALHDLGKISPGFQSKRDDLIGEQKARGYPFPRLTEPDHGQVTLRHLRFRAQGDRSADLLARAIAGHHGRFHPREPAEQRAKDGTGLWWQAREAAIAALASLFAVESGSVLRPPGFSPAEAMILAGLTTVADWIGSVKKFFPPEGSRPREMQAYADEAYSRASSALDCLGWDAWQPDAQVWDFARLYPELSPNPLQQLTARLAFELPGPALVIIEAPMGMGKTEAALHLADVLANRFGHAGLYDALPTQATSNQIFRRVRDDYLGPRLAGHPANLHLLHGLAAFNDAYAELLEGKLTPLEPSDVSDMDGVPGGTEASVTAAAWFRGRKLGLLSPFAVGTVDQALMGALQAPHMFVRLHGLANKVVVIDEAHAYDTYTSTLLDCLIEWLGALDCSVIILSATLPQARRRALVRAYGASSASREEATYPRVTLATRSGTSEALPIDGAAEKAVSLERLQAASDVLQEAVVADRLAHELREGGCAGWICNTVDSAQLAYLQLRTLKEQRHPVFHSAELVLYHARFPVEQRQAIENEIDRKFGKKGLESGERPPCAVLLGTQVLEQALDYSVDVMVTELAPVDLVLQRSGRLQRHAHPRAMPLQQPRLLWIEPGLNVAGEPEFGVSGCVYEESVLLRSWHALLHCPAVNLPGGIEELVEAVYRVPPAPLPAPLQRLEARLDQKSLIKQSRHVGQALANAIHRPTAEDPFKMDRMLPDDDADVDIQGFPGTRLAAPSVSLVCACARGDDIVLRPTDTRTLKRDAPLSRDDEKEILRRSVRLQSRRWVRHFQKEAVPKGWKDSPVLRHHRLAVFTDGYLDVDGARVRLDADLGLVTSPTVLEKLP